MVSLLVGKKHVETASEEKEVPGVVGWRAAEEEKPQGGLKGLTEGWFGRTKSDQAENKPTEEEKPNGLWGGFLGMGYSGSPTPPIAQVAGGELPTNSPLGAVPRGVVNTFF